MAPLSEIHEIAADIGAGVGMENVELACRFQHLRQEGRAVLRFEQVYDEGNHRPAVLGLHLIQRRPVAVDGDHACAGPQHGFRAGKSNSRGRAGNGSDLALEFICQWGYPSRYPSITGTKSSATIPPSPMLSSTGSFTTPTVST